MRSGPFLFRKSRSCRGHLLGDRETGQCDRRDPAACGRVSETVLDTILTGPLVSEPPSLLVQVSRRAVVVADREGSVVGVPIVRHPGDAGLAVRHRVVLDVESESRRLLEDRRFFLLLPGEEEVVGVPAV